MLVVPNATSRYLRDAMRATHFQGTPELWGDETDSAADVWGSRLRGLLCRPGEWVASITNHTNPFRSLVLRFFIVHLENP